MNTEMQPYEEFENDSIDYWAYVERIKEIQEGIEPPPGFKPGSHTKLAAINASTAPKDINDTSRIHTTFDYIYYLVPDLLQITNCPYYWGKMDRHEAEKLLENRPEGTFLLRDSTQEEYLFSVSFNNYGKPMHWRIEQWNHLYSFDSKDPSVFASSTVCGLIEHFINTKCCMYFEPTLTIPLHRNFQFSLVHMCRATICNIITYDEVNNLKLSKLLKSYLKEYHYKQRVRVRIFVSDAYKN